MVVYSAEERSVRRPFWATPLVEGRLFPSLVIAAAATARGTRAVIAGFTDLGSNVLGSAGPAASYPDNQGVFYPSALADARSP